MQSVAQQPPTITAPKEKKKPGRKRTRISKIEQLLRNLPKGFVFTGPDGCCTETYILEQLKNDCVLESKEDAQSSASHRLDGTQDTETRSFQIGCFLIDIDVVKVSDLKAMRKLLPRGDYKQIKNRKCARLSRFRRKELTLNLQEQNRRLR